MLISRLSDFTMEDSGSLHAYFTNKSCSSPCPSQIVISPSELQALVMDKERKGGKGAFGFVTAS